MPAADVQYVLDSSLECGHIGGDTHFYLMELSANANAVVDDYESAPHDPTVSHWSRLTDMGLYFEEKYLDWRTKRPGDFHLASYQGLRNIPYAFREMARTAASHIVENKFGGMTPAATQHLEERFEFSRAIQIMRRSMRRASTDFSGAGREDMRAIKNQVDGKYDENRAAYQIAIANLRQTVGDTPWNDRGIDRHRVDLKLTKSLLRERMIEERKVIKRSVKFLTRLVGPETTRMFIGGEGVRFEGKHAIYELRKMSNALESHGGFRALSVFHKEHPDLLLCQICINTPNVPLLDHVASLYLHIKAGEEDKILEIGNATSVHDSAYDLDWLAPHLPKKYVPGENENRFHMSIFPWNTEENREEHKRQVADMYKVTARHLYDEVLADYLPVLRAADLKIGWDRFHVAEEPPHLTNPAVAGW